MNVSKTTHTVGLSLATALTILMLLGIDSLAQPEVQAMSAMAQAAPHESTRSGT